MAPPITDSRKPPRKTNDQGDDSSTGQSSESSSSSESDVEVTKPQKRKSKQRDPSPAWVEKVRKLARRSISMQSIYSSPVL